MEAVAIAVVVTVVVVIVLEMSRGRRKRAETSRSPLYEEVSKFPHTRIRTQKTKRKTAGRTKDGMRANGKNHVE